MAEENYYKVIEAAEGMLLISEPTGVGSVLVLGEEKALLIDTGFGFSDLRKVVEGLTDLPYEVLVTHGHLDHFGGAYLFDRIWFNMEDKASYDWYQATQKTLMVEKFERDRAAAGLPDVWPTDFDREIYYAKTYPPMDPLTDGQIFDLGGRKLTAMTLPGHTKGSMVVWDDKTQILISGDSISDSQWMFFQWSDTVRNYGDALERLMALPVKGVLPAHHKRVLPPQIMAAQLANVRSVTPDKDRLFIHPRTKLEGLMHKSPCEGIDGIKNVYIVYRSDLVI